MAVTPTWKGLSLIHSGSDILIYLPVIFLVVYGAVGGLVFSRWERRRRQRRTPSIHVDPEAWLASWFPQRVAIDLFMVVGVIVTGLLTLFVTGMAYRAGTMYTLGFGIGLVIVALLFAGIDVAIVLWVRVMRRRTPSPPDTETQ